MKRVRIATGQAAIISQYGAYQRTLSAGIHWLGFWEEAEIHELTQPFASRFPLNLLLQDAHLATMLEVVEVADHEIAMKYEDGNFKSLLQPGKHVFWKGVTAYTFTHIDLRIAEIPDTLDKHKLLRSELQFYLRVFVVDAHERGLLFRDGVCEQELGPGTYHFWKNSETISVLKTDLRQRQLEVAGQEILTKDKAALRINFQALYRVTDLKKALVENKNYEQTLYLLAQLALRELVGTMSLDELLEKKGELAPVLLEAINPQATSIGVALHSCGIRDIILPGDVKEIMSRVLVAQKTAQANLITRREETASTRSLLNTAKLMEENEMLFKLKEMEYVEKIAEKINNLSLSGGSQVLDQLKEIFSK